MNKKMRELMESYNNTVNQAKAFMVEGEGRDVAKASELMGKAEAIMAEFEVEKAIYNAHIENVPEVPVEPKKAEESEDAKFCKAVRSIVAGKRLVEGTDADGGYTVPEDISTKVHEFPDADFSFLNLINVEHVSTNKGARTYQVRAEADAAVDLDENGAITTELTAPTFTRISYAIQDRAAFLPVSNDLIADSDASILGMVRKWVGKTDAATANKKILEIVKAHEQTDLKDVDGIQEAINITLGQAYKAGAVIVTNDSGLQYLSTLKDENGRYLLNPDPTAPASMQLRCGVNVVPVKVVPNKVLANNEKKVPFIVGDLKEAITKFDRQSMSIKASDVATIGSFNAYAMNMTVLRLIMRDDYKEIDPDAYVWGYITVGE